MTRAETLLNEVLDLPTEERARFVLRLAESLDEQADPGAEEAWAEEIGERVRALRRGEARTISATEALARAQARIDRRRRG